MCEIELIAHNYNIYIYIKLLYVFLCVCDLPVCAP